MIDLSPQSQDKVSGAAELHPVPRHDAAPGDRNVRRSPWRHFSHDHAEAGVQLLSRWAGPVVLVAAILFLGWLLIG